MKLSVKGKTKNDLKRVCFHFDGETRHRIDLGLEKIEKNVGLDISKTLLIKAALTDYVAKCTRILKDGDKDAVDHLKRTLHVLAGKPMPVEVKNNAD